MKESKIKVLKNKILALETTPGLPGEKEFLLARLEELRAPKRALYARHKVFTKWANESNPIQSKDS